MLFGLVRSSHRLSRRSHLLLSQCGASFRQQYSYSSNRDRGGGGPSLSNPSVASVLALRPDSNGGGPQRTQVTVAGFVRTIRNQKQRSFVELGDGSTLYALQAVVSPSHAKGYVFLFFLCFIFFSDATLNRKPKKKPFTAQR